jgi:glycosyltransferase involved in cell wall biosynthesis
MAKHVRPKVVIAQKSLSAYRTGFYEGLRAELEDRGIELLLVFGNPFGADAMKADSADLPWAINRPSRFVRMRSRQLIWQPIWDIVRDADLVIVEQASKLLLNYLLLIRQQMKNGPRVALWGHGVNLQRQNASWLGELLKSRYSRFPHWWFAYTSGVSERVNNLGYPSDRITVVQNSIDTRSLKSQIDAVTERELVEFRAATGTTPGLTGLFLGSLYKEKRLEFLLNAADRIAEECPGFVLVVAGDGPQRSVVERHARTRPWVQSLGRVDGSMRATALRAADVLLMPGLVGLVVLDAFVAEAPLITTAIDFHSPEIEYLVDGQNGVMVTRWQDSGEYASTVAELLRNQDRLAVLRKGCRIATKIYTNEEMVIRFVNGIENALGRNAGARR